MTTGLQFQSTPMREGEPRPRTGSRSGASFNPRPCVRANPALFGSGQRLRMFQSTPMREGERRRRRRPTCAASFQSTPMREGERAPDGGRDDEPGVSIHAHA